MKALELDYENKKISVKGVWRYKELMTELNGLLHRPDKKEKEWQIEGITTEVPYIWTYPSSIPITREPLFNTTADSNE